ncbi:MAG TPA: DUF5655 domain-containing protein [Acidimicrobiia bacterium]
MGKRWTCPECGRKFGKPGQSHDCAPALGIEEYFETGPAHERPVYEAVRAHLDTLDDVYVEPVSVGIFFKRSRTFAQLRPKQKWVALGFVLPRKLEHPRLARKVIGEGSRYYHVVNLRNPDDVDDTVRDWLTEAYVHGD